jgi:pimeloyl-ACP methyl ester carboxylesterase
MTTYVLVHGGWAGGWFWGRVRPLLREAGHEVFTPTLTGLGERAHLARPSVNLETHIEDVVATIKYEDLCRVVLVGQSYAGMVISGVAERVPERLAHLVFLDAFVPRDGESLADILGPQAMASFAQLAEAQGDGWRLPLPFSFEELGITSELDIAWVRSKLVSHPLATMQQGVQVSNPDAAKLPRTFIRCTKPAMGYFDRFGEQARAAGWSYSEIASGHSAPVTAPAEVARALLTIAA